MAIYQGTSAKEYPIYGASRLGVYFKTGNTAVYQITDHLGNVRALVQESGTLAGATDYYPFGMVMPGRSLQNAEGYRYTYQGQEKDPETGKEAFELRLWDSRIGRWLTTDPYYQYASPYLGMGNNPISRIDPNGGEDWHYDKNGNLVSDVGDNAQTLADFKGIDISEAQYIIASEGFFIDYNNGVGMDLMAGQVARNREFGSPYNINQNLSFSKSFSADYGFSSWGKVGSTFVPKGTGGGIMVAGGLDMHAFVTYSNGNHYLNVSATATINNDTRNKVNSFLNVKYSNDNSRRSATESWRIEPRGETVLTQAGTLYVGSQTLLLPKNPNEISRLNMTLGVHQRLPGGGVSSISLDTNLLPAIIH